MYQEIWNIVFLIVLSFLPCDNNFIILRLYILFKIHRLLDGLINIPCFQFFSSPCIVRARYMHIHFERVLFPKRTTRQWFSCFFANLVYVGFALITENRKTFPIFYRWYVQGFYHRWTIIARTFCPSILKEIFFRGLPSAYIHFSFSLAYLYY